MRIFLTDLTAYNEGHLVGRWIDLPCDNLQEQLQEILKEGAEICKRSNELGINNYTNTHEEYFVTDSEGFPYEVDEYADIHKLNTFSEDLATLGDQDIKKINYLIDYNGATFEEALENCNLVDLYEDMTLQDLAYELVEEGCFGAIPDSSLAQYIDYEAIARDLQYDYTVVNNDIFRAD